MCGPLNRKGLLCRDCLDGFGPTVFTTDGMCENCERLSHYGVALYLLLELLPITAFYFLVVVFQIRVTSAPLNGFILFSQVVVIAYNSVVALRAMSAYTGTTYTVLGKIIFTGYGMVLPPSLMSLLPSCCYHIQNSYLWHFF